MTGRWLASLAIALFAGPALAQAMPGMDMPPAPTAPASHEHGHQHHSPPPSAARADEHGGHDRHGMETPEAPTLRDEPAAPGGGASGTDLPAGNTPPPVASHDRSADRYYGTEAMAAAESRMMRAHDGGSYHQILFNLAEVQLRRGRNAYRWTGEAWFGGDIDRLVLKTEGEGLRGRHLESAEAQALYSRAIDPYWNLQAGLRHDFRPGASRTYAVVGIEGLAPLWFEAEAALFLSNKGDLLGRAEAYHDMRLTQRWVLQPRVELNFAAQQVREQDLGAGLTSAEVGLRLRYELRREFAPYIGVSWERRVGTTGRWARATGEAVQSTSLVTGLRFWF